MDNNSISNPQPVPPQPPDLQSQSIPSQSGNLDLQPQPSPSQNSDLALQPQSSPSQSADLALQSTPSQPDVSQLEPTQPTPPPSMADPQLSSPELTSTEPVANPQPVDIQSVYPESTSAQDAESYSAPVQSKGIFTNGVAQVVPAQAITPEPQKPHNNKLTTIIIATFVVLVIGVVGFLLIPKLFNNKKTVAEFKQIISNLNYTEIPEGSQETDKGKTAIYMKGDNSKIEGVAMFLEASSKDTLRQMLEQSMSNLGNIESSGVDLSKDYNKSLDCFSNKNNHTCVGVVLKENTVLFTMSNSNSSEDTARAEIEKVIDAMGYQE